MTRYLIPSRFFRAHLPGPFRRAHRLEAGKIPYKDCVILETYLERVRELREDGLTAPIVFVSSNTRDYAEHSEARVRNDIKDEFESLELEYAPNMAAAKHMLKL